MFSGSRFWTPRSNTLNSGVVFHFADEKVRVRSVASQGKPSSDDCVTEYFVQYSDDGESWANYVDSTGEFEVTLWRTTCARLPTVVCGCVEFFFSSISR